MTPKNTHTIPNWQVERNKRLGTARQRRAAIAMLAPQMRRHFCEECCSEVFFDGAGGLYHGTPGARDYELDADHRPLPSPHSRNSPDVGGSTPAEPCPPKPVSAGAATLPSKELEMHTTKETLKSSTANVENLAPKLQPNVGARMVRKVTVAGLLPKNYEHPRGAPDLWLADFFCQVSGSKPEEYDGRPYLRWLGDFRRVDLSSGQIVGGATAIFPSIASDRIEAAMGLGENAAGGVRTNVEMAFRLGITGEGRTGREGYAWTLQTIMQPNYVAPIDRFVAECYRQPEALTGPEEQEMEDEAAQ